MRRRFSNVKHGPKMMLTPDVNVAGRVVHPITGMTDPSKKHRTWPMALVPPNRVCREAKSRCPSLARSASAFNTVSRKKRVQDGGQADRET